MLGPGSVAVGLVGGRCNKTIDISARHQNTEDAAAQPLRGPSSTNKTGVVCLSLGFPIFPLCLSSLRSPLTLLPCPFH